MNRNQVWVIFLFSVASIIFLFSFKTFFDLYQFLSLTESVTAQEVEGQIIKLRKGQYGVQVGYSYQVGGREYQRVQNISSRRKFKNRWLAEESYREIQKKSHQVWFSKNYPEKGQLDKRFPVRGIFSTTILVGILVYFFLLGKYMLKTEL